MVGRIAYICLNESSNIIIGRLIENGYKVDIIRSKSDLKMIKQFDKIKLIAVHVSSEAADELEIADYMKRSFGFKHAKFFVISSFTGRDVIMKALQIGAEDILTEITDSELVVKRIEDVSGIKAVKSPENLYVEKDFILLSFKELVEREVKAASRGEYELSIVYLYPVNEIGLYRNVTEDYLSSLKTIVKNSLRDTDYVFIQDKFIAAILPFANEEGCRIVIDRLKNTYRSHPALKPINNFTMLESSCVTFPTDGRVTEKLLYKVGTNIERLRVRQDIG